MMCLTLAHVGSSLAAPSSTEPDPAREIQRRAADFRTARLDTGRRVAAVEALLEQGPEGEEAAADLFRRELGRLREGVSARPQTPELDAEIERLREILAKLRSQADLSKEQLKQVGLPALDRLTMVYRRQSAQLSRYRRDVDNLLKQLDALESVLRELKSRGTDGAAFPTDRFLAEADELRRGALTPEEREAFEVAAKNAKLAPQLEPGVVAGMNAVNAMRVMCGVRPLVYDLKLCEAATGHSADMQQHGFFAHESPVPGKKTPWDRAKLAGTKASGENIFMGSSAAVNAVKGWFLSPPHHKNMLGEAHHRQGLGRVGKYWTQMFGR